jgi:hypothetical protein
MAQSPNGLKAEERAEVVVTRLERFIRDHRTLSGGVSFRKWQDLAKNEIADLLREIETEQVREHRYIERTLIVVGIGLATIGFWGTVLALAMAPDRVIAGVLTMLGGLISLWGIGALGLRSPFKRFQTENARITLDRLRTVNRKVSDLEHQLKKRKKALEKEIDALPDDA